MERTAIIVALVATLGAVQGRVSATPTVNPADGAVVTDLGSNNFSIVITPPNSSFDSYQIDSAATDKILSVSIDTSNIGSNDVNIAFGTSGALQIPLRVDKVIRSAGTGIVGITRLRTVGDIGLATPNASDEIVVHSITLIECAGSIYVPVRVLNGGTDIGDVRVSSNLQASITNPEGALGILTIGGSITGTSTAATQVFAASGIAELHCSGSVNEYVLIGDTNNPMPVLGYSFLNPTIWIEGNFAGNMSLSTLPEQSGTELPIIQIDGDLSGDIALSEATPPEPAPYGTVVAIRVGGDVTADASIAIVPAEGLQSQIDVNSEETGGDWEGPVSIDGKEIDWLTTAGRLYGQYPEKSADLGGGAVGLVPYKVHGTDSVLKFTPSGGGSVDQYTESNVDAIIAKTHRNYTETVEFTIRFYGYITKPGSPWEPIRLERRLQGSTGSWREQTTCFDFGWTHMNEFDDPRAILVDGFGTDPTDPYQFLNGYEYRLRPVTVGSNRVICDLGNSITNPPVSNEDWITFKDGNCCPWDIDGSGTTNSTDLNILLVNYGLSNLTCGIRGDVDDDLDVDSTDLNIVLVEMGETCSCGSLSVGGGEGGGHPAPPCIAVFGFQTVESFMEWFEKQSSEEQFHFISVLLEVLPQFIEEEAE